MISAVTPSPSRTSPATGGAVSPLVATAVPACEAFTAGRRWAQQRQWSRALPAFEQAVAAHPQDALAWVNLANTQRHLEQWTQAEVSARRALDLSPGDRLALALRGECLARMHCYPQALAVYEDMQRLGVADAASLLQQGAMLQALGRPRQAVDVLLLALGKQPSLVRGHALLADALRDLGLKREAVECMRTVLALEPGNLEALSHLSFEKRHIAQWHELDDDLARIRRAVGPATPPSAAAVPRVAAAFGLLSLPLSPQELLQAARGESAALAWQVQPLPPLLPPVEAAGVDVGPVRVGLVSYDLREHPVSQLLVETLERLDRCLVRVHLYSAGPDDGSALRQRVMAAADHVVDLRGLSDAQAAQRIRDDGVELLIDLNGHTRGHRLGVFARRPAPVQVSWLGFPGSTGAPFIDYVIGDPIVTPLSHASHYSEHIAQMPVCLQPNGRWRPLPAPMTREQAGLPDDALVLCAFNHPYKILPPAFDAWCGALRQHPRAVLWLKQPNGQLRAQLVAEAQARGVDPQRLVFATNVPWEQHFSRLALADLFVDTWPYNAHTTASDALWAGVPVLTLCGPTYASRVATSVLHACGMAGLSCPDEAAYLERLDGLLREPAELQRWRQHLQSRRDSLPLFDCAAHTRALESLWRRMVQRWRQGLPPAALAAADGGPDTGAPHATGASPDPGMPTAPPVADSHPGPAARG